VIALVLTDRMTAPVAVMPLLAGALAGVAYDMQLSARVASRRARLTDELPTMLEFLSLCLSAGEGFLDSLRRVTTVGSGELTGELRQVVLAVNTGSPLAEALAAMAARLQLPGLTRAVDQVIAALERGAPLAGVLHAQAGDAREDAKRTLIEQAGRKEILMLLPSKIARRYFVGERLPESARSDLPGQELLIRHRFQLVPLLGKLGKPAAVLLDVHAPVLGQRFALRRVIPEPVLESFARLNPRSLSVSFRFGAVLFGQRDLFMQIIESLPARRQRGEKVSFLPNYSRVSISAGADSVCLRFRSKSHSLGFGRRLRPFRFMFKRCGLTFALSLRGCLDLRRCDFCCLCVLPSVGMEDPRADECGEHRAKDGSDGHHDDVAPRDRLRGNEEHDPEYSRRDANPGGDPLRSAAHQISKP
jgi:hypothetical protein